jgi:hypothetical protein
MFYLVRTSSQYQYVDLGLRQEYLNQRLFFGIFQDDTAEKMISVILLDDNKKPK